MKMVQHVLGPAVVAAVLAAAPALGGARARDCRNLPWHVNTGASVNITTRGVTCRKADRVIRRDASLQPETILGFACSARPTQHGTVYERCVRGWQWIKWTSED